MRCKHYAGLDKIAERLLAAKGVILFTHHQVDGDCLGSALAICSALKRLGKKAVVLMKDKVPDYLSFLNEGDVWTANGDLDEMERIREKAKKLVGKDYTALSVDCSSPDRFPYPELFEGAKERLVVDHHGTNKGFGDYCFAKESAACGEHVYRLIRKFAQKPNAYEATCLYTAIVTDSGRFQYPMTDANTLRVAADLYQCGMDQQKVTINVFQSDRPEKVALQTRIKSHMEFCDGGRSVFTTMTLKELDDIGAYMDECEGLVEDLRNIKGVEVACFVREKRDGALKVSLRSKSTCDVAAICDKLSGGGHPRAAGCDLHDMSLEEAIAFMKKEVREALRKA